MVLPILSNSALRSNINVRPVQNSAITMVSWQTAFAKSGDTPETLRVFPCISRQWNRFGFGLSSYEEVIALFINMVA
jgi:hypothetical protein